MKFDLRGKSRADQYAIAAEFAGVSPDVLKGIARTESSDGKNMRSPAGARGWFGIMPTTQSTWEDREGRPFDPDNFEDGLTLAALQMRENMRSTKGSLPDALRMYNAGTDRRNWNNKETQAYVGKVLGKYEETSSQQTADHARIKGFTMDDFRSMTTEQLMDIRPMDLDKVEKARKPPKELSADKQALQAISAPPIALTQPMGTAQQDAQQDTVDAAQEKDHADKLAITPDQKLAAAFEDVSLTSAIIRTFNRDHNEADPAFMQHYADNWQEYEKDVANEHDAERLRATTSQGDYDRVKQEIADSKERQAKYASTTSDGLVYGSVATLADPASLAIGVGVGKALQIAGMGSRALMLGRAAKAAEEEITVPLRYLRRGMEYEDGSWQLARVRKQHWLSDPGGAFAAGDWYDVMRTLPAVAEQAYVAPRPLAAVLSAAAEGGLGNVFADATLDAMGDHKTTNDYARDAGIGLAFGLVASPFIWKGAKTAEAVGNAENIVKEAAERDAALYLKAQTNLGSEATSTQIAAEARRLDTEEKVDWLRMSLAEVPEEHRFVLETDGTVRTSDQAVVDDISKRYDMEAVSDPNERALTLEYIASSEAMAKANPINEKGVKSILAKMKLGDDRGLESTGMTLLASESPVARSISMTLLEGANGAGGRRRTAAMTQVVRERLYNEQFNAYDGFYNVYRKSRGAGIIGEAFDGKVRKEFNRAVALEVEARNVAPGVARTEPLPHPMVTRAADLWEKGMDLMRTEQQAVGTVGSARLGTSSVGYFTHKLDPRKVADLSADQAKIVRGKLADQFVDPQNGFDRKFANKLAAKYLETATDKRFGMAPVPMNLHSPEAADIVEGALKAMGTPAADVKKLMDKFSRGGANHTKKRLRLNLNEDIGGGAKLIDLFDTDVMGLYRGYARRTSGEVALAQYGIMGRKGLQVAKQAMKATGASTADMAAFDQIAAEFLNQPFGNFNHKYMDNARILTSMSRLGGMGFTQMGEYGNALAVLGVHRTFNAIADMPRLIKEVGHFKAGGVSKNPILGSIDTLGGVLGMDHYQTQRIFDVPDNDIKMYGTEQVGVATRAMRAGGNAQAILSGQRMVTAVQTRGLAEQIVRKMVQYAQSGLEDKALRDMGLSAELQGKLKADLPNIAEFDASGKLKSLDLLKSKMDAKDVMTIRASVERGSSQIIQRTYTGETGKWAHDGLLKFLFQFRTFSLISIEKQFGRNNLNYGALKSFAYLLGAMSFAIPIHAARVHIQTLGMTRSKREEYLEQKLNPMAFARATLNYASASGMLGDVFDVGVGATSPYFGEAGKGFSESVGVRGGSSKRILGGVLAPGVNTIEDLGGLVNGNPHKALKALPFSNLPYVQPLFNLAEGDED